MKWTALSPRDQAEIKQLYADWSDVAFPVYDWVYRLVSKVPIRRYRWEYRLPGRRKTVPKPTGKRYPSVSAMKTGTRPVRAAKVRLLSWEGNDDVPTTRAYILPATRASYDQMIEQVSRASSIPDGQTIGADAAHAALAAIGITRPAR